MAGGHELTQPLPSTALGWKVGDITATVARLAKHRVQPERFANLNQNDAGVWASPSGREDRPLKAPDGNVLSLTE